MKKLSAIIFLTVATGIFAFAQSKPKTPAMNYRLSVQIIPESGSVSGVVEIEHPCDSVMYLTKGLSVTEITSGGKPVSFSNEFPKSNPYSVRITLRKLPQTLKIRYSGQIRPGDYPKSVSNLNQLSSEVIELTDIIDWYPRTKTSGPFTFSLQAEVPSSFGLVTNGTIKKEVQSKGKSIIKAQSSKPVYGISILGSPELKKSVAEAEGYSVEIFYSKLPKAYVDSMKADLLKTLQFYKDMYGSSGAKHLVRIIYSPRPAGGYARGSIIVVSEKFALEQRSNKFGYARDFRLNAHEIAHLWSKASTSTPDDWINEGLAEFSALLASEKLIGKSFSDLLISEYQGIVDISKTQTPIL